MALHVEGLASCGAVERGSATTPRAFFFLFNRQFLLPGVGRVRHPRILLLHSLRPRDFMHLLSTFLSFVPLSLFLSFFYTELILLSLVSLFIERGEGIE